MSIFVIHAKWNPNTIRMVELRALMREHGLRGNSRLRKAELITFLGGNLHPRPTMEPSSSQSVMLRPRPPEGSFIHMNWSELSGGFIGVSESIEGVGLMWKPLER